MTIGAAFSGSFQSTFPLRGATRAKARLDVGEQISIHVPLAGSDDQGKRRGRRPKNFNPRSPYGERLDCLEFCQLLRRISIHTPLAGSDSLILPSRVLVSIFQSTLPLRGATKSSPNCTPRFEFQSTLPLRGATGNATQPVADNGISIHTPLAGSDHPQWL